MGRVTHAVVGLCALCACGAPRVVLDPPPHLDPSGAVLFVLEAEPAAPRVFAEDGGAPRLFAADLSLEGRTRITALTYGAPLAELGLAAGEITLVEPTECGARALPPQSGLHILELDDREPGAWAPVDERPGVVAALTIAGPCPCRSFEQVEVVPLPVNLVAFFAEETAQRTLLLDRDGTFSWIDASGALSPVETATSAPAAGLRTVERQPDGTLWLANKDGELWRGRPGQTFERAAALTVEDDFFRHIAGGLGPDGYELYGISESGYLFQLYPTEPQPLLSLEAPPLASAQRARVLWLGPGELITAPQAGLDLVWVTDGAEVARNSLPIASNGVHFLTSVPGIGVVVISKDSRIFEIEGFDIVPRDEAPELSTPSGFVTFEGAYVYAGDTGYLQEYRADYGFCPTRYLETQAPILAMFALGDRIGLVTFIGDSYDLQVVLIDASEPLEGR